MLKKEIRKQYRQKRADLSAQQKSKLDDLLLIQFQTVPLPYVSNVLSFYPIEEKGEINSFIITEYLKFQNPGLHIAFPKTDLSTHTMKAVGITIDTAFENNQYNIPEPIGNTIIDAQDLALVLVPMLAFDLKGHRVGYGKGFYDRFLQDCNRDCIKIGLCYFEPVQAIKDSHQFDVPLNFCITPQKVYVF